MGQSTTSEKQGSARATEDGDAPGKMEEKRDVAGIFGDADSEEIDDLVDQIGEIAAAAPRVPGSEDSPKATQQGTEKENKISRSEKKTMENNQNSEGNKTNNNNGAASAAKTVRITLTVNETDWWLMQFIAKAQNKPDATVYVQEMIGRMCESAEEKMRGAVAGFDYPPRAAATGKKS